MTTAQIEQRLLELERTVEELKAKVERSPGAETSWWREGAGRFRDDPVFDEISRLGEEYRRSLRPAETPGGGEGDRP